MNPFQSILSDLQLQNHASGPAGTLYLLCTFGAANYSGTVTTNPYTEVRRLLKASGGDSQGLREIGVLLTSGESRWNQR